MNTTAGTPFVGQSNADIVSAIGIVAPDGWAREPIETPFTIHMPRRPYPGLRPFEKDEWPIFFGRERMADTVVAQLVAKRLLVVHGDSGCGKSSLIRAAVLPRLEQDNARGGIRWRTAATTPGEAPLWNLARALAGLNGDEPDDARVLEIRRMLNYGRQAPAALAALLRRSEADHVCILIDQFEELFDHARREGPDEAQLLVAFLNSLFEYPPDGLYAVLTMRSEFLGACARFQGFAETVNATQYLLPRMEHDDLVRAIREPAALFDGSIDTQLTERLISDASGNQDQLPLIQHGLMLMYRDHVLGAKDAARQHTGEEHLHPRGTWQLGLEQFKASGGLAAQLSGHASKVMGEALLALGGKGPEMRVVEDMFRALTDINTELQAIRRPCTLARLASVTGASVEVLRGIVGKFRVDGVSFLKPYGNETIGLDDLIDISHEALIRCWTKLADPKDGWLIREFRNGLVWRSLLVQADSFERNASNVLGPTLTGERRQWLKRRNPHWAERYGGGWERVMELVEASERDRDRKAIEQAELLDAGVRAKQLKRKVYVYSVAVIFAAALALALGVGLLSVSKSETEAQTARAQSEMARKQSEIARKQSEIARKQSEMAREQSEMARARSDAAVMEAVGSLEALRKVVSDLQSAASSATPKAAVQQSLNSAQKALATQTNSLGKLGVAVSPRIYIHISNESQRPAARAFESALESRDIDQVRLVVPGIELVNTSLRRSVLRCFRASECGTEAPRLVEIVNKLLERPQVVLEDLSATYGNATNIRDRHYEIWFAPGDVALRASVPTSK